MDLLLTIIFATLSFIAFKLWQFTHPWIKPNVVHLKPEPLFGTVRQMGLVRLLARGKGIISIDRSYPQGLSWLQSHLKSDMFQVWLGGNHSTVVCRPEWAEQVFSNYKCFDQSHTTMQEFKLYFPNGLLALNGEIHRRHAAVIRPALRTEVVKHSIHHIIDGIDKLVNIWKLRCVQQNPTSSDNLLQNRNKYTEKSIVADCQDCILDILGLLSFNRDFGNLKLPRDVGEDVKNSKPRSDNVCNVYNENKQESLGKTIREFVHFVTPLLLLALPHFITRNYLRWSSTYRRLNETLKLQINQMIDEELTKRLESNPSVTLLSQLVNSLDHQSHIGNDAIDSANDSNLPKNLLSREEIVDEIKLLLIGALDTTSAALTWFIYFASKNPQVQANLKAELKANNINKDTYINQSQLDELPYLEAVVKETLRLAPLSASVTRTVTKETHLNDIRFEPGEQVQVAYYNMHMDPRYWKIDPTQFNPDRFYDFNKATKGIDSDHHPFAFRTFGGGNHSCAGQQVARYELRVIIGRLMQSLTFHDHPENVVTHNQRITVTPKNMKVQIEFNN